MIRTLILATCAAALAACSPTLSAETDARTPAAGTLPTALNEIAGSWDILSFDGYRPARLDTDGQRHAFVNVEGDEVRLAIECNYTGLRATIQNGRLVALPSDQLQTEMGCGPEREARDEAFFAFMRTSPTIISHTHTDLVLENGGKRLELQRPDVRRRSLLPSQISELDGSWRADIIYERPEPGRTDNLLAELAGAPARFTIADGEIRLVYDCETLVAPAALTAPGAIRVREVAVTRSVLGTCSVPEANRIKIATFLAGDINAENIPPSGLYLEAGNVYAVLRRD